MSLFASPKFLRTLLWADAASCLATAALHLLASGPVAGLLGPPQPLVTGSGLVLCGFVAVAVYLGTQVPVRRRLVGALVAANLAWAAAALALLWGSGLTPTMAGKAYLLVQALAVGALAELQWTALRRVARGA